MRRLPLIAFLSFSVAAYAQAPAPEEQDYLFNLAVFEYNVKSSVTVPWKDFGEPLSHKDEVHKKTAQGTIDTSSVHQLKVVNAANYLRSKSAAKLVTNVTIKAGDVIRVPCGAGTNLELDFSAAATKPGNQSTLLLRIFQMKTQLPPGTEYVGAMAGAKAAAVEEVYAEFPTVEGDTFVIEVARSMPAKERKGCVVLVSP